MADSGRIEKKRDRQTNQADMGQKRRSHRMNITALLIFLFLFIGCSLLQYANNGQNAQKSCGLMLDQMKELITENERSFQPRSNAGSVWNYRELPFCLHRN